MFANRKIHVQFLHIVMILLFALLSACSNGSSNNNNDSNTVPQTGNNSDATTVNVSMTNFEFQLDKTDIPAGKVTFHVKNDAQDAAHEMVVLKTDLPANQLPTNEQKLVDEDKLQSLGEVEKEVGESGDLTVNLDPGHYVLLCNEPGHYSNGMALDINVE
jgi:uncharacterized cupredoxin-like copper-binding protein